MSKNITDAHNQETGHGDEPLATVALYNDHRRQHSDYKKILQK
jgi:hypothetical protein